MQKEIKTPINVVSFLHPETKKTFYTPESDIIFRSIFGNEGNEKITKSFIEGIIEEKIEEDIDVNVNPEYKCENVKDKQMVSDVKVKCNESRNLIILEMQNKVENFITQRFSVYTHKAYHETLKQGTKYNKLKKVTLVAILANNIPKFKDIEQYHTVWNGREKEFSEYIFDENVTIHIIELKKYIKYKKETNKINPWLEFIIQPLGKGVEEAMRSKEELRLAVDMLHLLNRDQEVVDIAFRELMADIDRNSFISCAEEKGMEKGMKKGMEKEKIEIAIKMLKKGMDSKVIEEITGLTEKEISQIAS